MRTRTIFEAHTETCYLISGGGLIGRDAGKVLRQSMRFRNELIRRVDEYDRWREIENRLPKLSDMRGILKGQLKPEYKGMASEDIIRDVRRKMWGDE